MFNSVNLSSRSEIRQPKRVETITQILGTDRTAQLLSQYYFTFAWRWDQISGRQMMGCLRSIPSVHLDSNPIRSQFGFEFTALGVSLLV
jgi:hypothetical protein